ncbi:MAG: DUF2071 domain-containing protein [Planctomycetaceae bacterium]|nr:DUF2071 domain-containing protein [Planctomycetaceae bacterium]
MSERIVGYQRWSNLAFFHWRVEIAEIQALLPPGLTVDAFDGSAWIALVPFQMEGIRPWWAVPVPGISWFLETNVRTYVRHENGQTGVWFFSLDADQRLAVWIAQKFWHLNYVNARLQFQRSGDKLVGAGQRSGADVRRGDYQFAATITDQPPRTADPDSLEHFLLERYHLFARRPDGRYLCGQVHHPPYTYQPLQDISLTQSLTNAAGCAVDGAPDHAAFSPGVNVSVSPLVRI